jgi:hypothetical protein
MYNKYMFVPATQNTMPAEVGTCPGHTKTFLECSKEITLESILKVVITLYLIFSNLYVMIVNWLRDFVNLKELSNDENVTYILDYLCTS